MTKKISFFEEDDLFTQEPIKKKEFSTGCESCGFDKDAVITCYPHTGHGGQGIFIITEQPAHRKEIYHQKLKQLGIVTDRDCVIMPAMGCRGVPDKNPSDMQIRCCRSFLLDAIKEYKPKVVITLGLIALKALYLDKIPFSDKDTSTKWRGYTIPDRDLKAWVCPTFPSFYVSGNDSPVAERLFDADLEQAVSCLQRPWIDYEDEAGQILTLSSQKEVKAYLQDILMSKEPVALDWETTGLKPYRDGHKIYTASFCYKEDEAIAFKMEPEYHPLVKSILAKEKLGKIAQNMKFEHNWAKAFLKCETKGWLWDTMLASHILDCRSGITGLKFQAFVQYGIIGYQTSVDKYLAAPDAMVKVQGANAFNTIHKAPLKELLIYNGIDSLVTRRLAMEQICEFSHEDKLREAYELFHNGTIALAHAEFNGFCIDDAICQKTIDKIEKGIKEKIAELSNTKEIQQWKAAYQSKFLITSTDQLSEMLFKHWGYTPSKKTQSGKNSADKNVLAELADEIPLVGDLLYIKKMQTCKNTFLKGIYRECSGGEIHTFYDLNNVDTYRSSSNSPNWHNIPVRDPDVKKYVRSIIFPHAGHSLVEIDFSGIEVKVAAAYHKDPVMMKYLTGGGDMHSDVAMQVYKLPPGQWTKDTRYCAKNRFVFPQFYGDWYKTCAESLWKAIPMMKLKTKSGIPLFEHLESQDIHCLEDFEDHVQKAEDWFWNKQFKVYTKWKEEHYESYLANGEFSSYTGFRYNGVLRKNQVINYPVQGAAFHCLLWCFTEIDKELIARNMESCVMGQIHDSAILGVAPHELNEVLATCIEIMTKKLPKHFTWINVPIEVEPEMTRVGESWYSKKQVHPYECECGADWAYKDVKDEEKIIIWECPICGKRTSEAIR